MDSKQEAKLSMYDAVISHCDDNAGIVATIPAFQTAFNLFKDLYENIVSAAQSEMQLINGYALDKTEQRKFLSQSANEVASAVFAFASATDNTVLREKVNYTPSDFRRFKDELLTPACQIVHDAANDNIAELEPYGITAGKLSDFQEIINDYAAVAPAPRNAVSQRTSFAALIKDLFRQGDDLLKTRLDKLALQFQTSQTGFYNAYKNNRMVLDTGTSSTQVAGTVTASNGSGPVINAVITIGEQPYTATTGINGEYTIKTPVPGIYSLVFTATGFVTKTVNNIEVSLGDTTALDVVMDLVPD